MTAEHTAWNPALAREPFRAANAATRIQIAA